MTDRTRNDELLSAFRSGDPKRAIGQLYDTALPKVVQLVKRQGGDEQEAYDVFQDGMTVLYRQVMRGAFDESQEVEGFLYVICRNRWYNRTRSRRRQDAFEDSPAEREAVQESHETALLTQERAQLARQALQRLGEPCQRLLKLAVFERLPMKEIAQKMGYKSEDSAKTRNYKCKKKLLALIEKDPSLKDALTP